MQPKKRRKINNSSIKFIDLFAGIGGFHIAFENLGCECVFISEWDKHARATYELNFKDKHPKLFTEKTFVGDINEITDSDEKIKSIPDFDVLTGGFPCQPFSQAGQKKGFLDRTRGTLFFNIVKILEIKKPNAYFIENVRGLLKHDGGKTIKVMEDTIKKLGYSFHKKVIRGSDFGKPTHRPRLFMVGFKGDSAHILPFKFPDPIPLTETMSDILGGRTDKVIGYTLRVGGKSSGIDDRRNWDMYMVNGLPRKITVDEARKLMGFPDNFVFPVSDTQAMKQLGNSVCIPAIQATANQIIKILKEYYG